MYLRSIFIQFLFVFVLTSAAFGQGKMVFTEEQFDFGNVIEGAIATHEFHFTNKGKEPIIISNVQASCGCTTPFWTKDPVLPGAKGTIKASYNSEGRIGAFNKSITITSNAETPSYALTIKGIVSEKPLISPSAKLEFESTLHDVGNVVKGKRIMKEVFVTNSGNAILDVSAVKSSCNCITASTLPTGIKPGAKAAVSLVYVPKQVGVFNEPIIFTTNDKNTPEVRMFIKAAVGEDKSLNSVVKESKSNIPFN